MAHDHTHSHERRAGNERRLMLTLMLAAAYMLAEAMGGWYANSLALLADAGHMLSDVAALALSLFAIRFARRPATSRRTYGYYRAEILAALVNSATLVAIAALILIEAYRRLRQPPEVIGGVMAVIAVGGLLVNLAGLWILNSGKKDSLNVRGAWLHVLTDALGSVGAIIAAALIWRFGWNVADPITSAVIALLVVYSSWSLMRESVEVLMESVPSHIDFDAVRDAVLSAPGVLAVHDLHIWTITSGMDALSAHVVTASEGPHNDLLAEIRHRLHHFGIDHLTIQIETEGYEEPHGHKL